MTKLVQISSVVWCRLVVSFGVGACAAFGGSAVSADILSGPSSVREQLIPRDAVRDPDYRSDFPRDVIPGYFEWKDRLKSKGFQFNFEYLALEPMRRETAELATESAYEYDLRDVVPEAWETLEQDLDVTEKKVRVTLRLDDSVAKFYRGMGPGYQARINRILATFAQMRIAQVRKSDERIDRYREEQRQIARMEAERKGMME